MINEAVYCLFEGVGTPQDIDEIMKLGMNHPMGPLTLADLIGLDTCLAIMKYFTQAWGCQVSALPVAGEIRGCRVARQKERKRVLQVLRQVPKMR